MDKIKKGLVGSILISVILAVTLTYVWATTPTTTFYISTGVYPGAPSYTVWTEGSGATQAYYAKRCDGYIPTWSGSTNASSVLSSALTAMNNQGLLKCVGRIILNTTLVITIPDWSKLSISFEIIRVNGDYDAIYLNGTSSHSVWCGSLSGNLLEVNYAAYTHHAVTLRNINKGIVSISEIYNIAYTVGTATGTAVYLLAESPGTDCDVNTVSVKYIQCFGVGIKLHAVSGIIANNRISDAHMMYIVNGSYMIDDRGTGYINDNSFYNLIADGTGGFMKNGFYNNGARNSYYSCESYDETASLEYSFYTIRIDSAYPSWRSSLFSCYGSKIGINAGNWTIFGGGYFNGTSWI